MPFSFYEPLLGTLRSIILGYVAKTSPVQKFSISLSGPGIMGIGLWKNVSVFDLEQLIQMKLYKT